MNASNPDQSVPKWKLAFVLIAAIGLTVFVLKGGRKTLEKRVETPIEEKSSIDLVKLFSAETLVSEGQFIIFGTDKPELEVSPTGVFDRMPIGKGKCAHCHRFVEGQGEKQSRGPDLRGLEQRSHGRTKEARYKVFLKKYSEAPEPDSGLKAKARTGGQYIIESIYCPNCYVVDGFGIPGSDGLKSEMPVMNHLPYQLSDYQVIAVVSYLQTKDTPGNFSKVTAVEDWQNYFKKELPLPDNSPKIFASSAGLTETEKLTDTVEEVIKKNGCAVCHKIPGIAFAQTGLMGPILAMQSASALHLSSPGYQKAVSSGRAKATTAREYVRESILNPSAFILPGFQSPSGMPSDYGTKMTLGDLDKLITFLLTIDESMIEKNARSTQ